ncbi:hypothetical protein [Aquabacter sediminis]|uniref:hypothetical protein n=1 Tax=Aquabacter sediminis TaxID=3029197 RepID=UPI00237E3D35|nr:hypothetical protein [Aquabacter sp. P-9]MDE1566652.1 hypothetical protein [Aquabacter sp. P-9]
MGAFHILGGVVAAVCLVAPAQAADVPNLVGRWTALETSGSSVVVTPMDQMSKPADPSVLASRPSGESWDVRIDAQDGRALAGALISKGGKEQTLLGTLRLDGKRLVIATDFSAGSGELEGDTMELCWVDLIPNYIATSCTVYKRAKAGAQ